MNLIRKLLVLVSLTLASTSVAGPPIIWNGTAAKILPPLLLSDQVQTDSIYSLGAGSIDLSTGIINDVSSNLSINWNTRSLSDGTSSQLTWTTSGIAFPQLTVSTVPYLNASGVLTSSAVTPTELGYLSGVTSSLQTQLNGKQSSGNYISALTGDVSATGPGSVSATVDSVGGSSAANVNSATILANAATDANTASAIVRRDGSGNFSAGTITGTLSGNATNVSGVVAIANGGTGQTAKAPAFDALSPMTTSQDLIVGGASGTGTRLPVGADNTVLKVLGGTITWSATPSPYAITTISGNTSATSGTTYICDTSGGAFTLTLPTPASGAFIGVVDKTGSFSTNNLTLAPNGSELILNVAGNKILQTDFYSHIFFSDGTDWYMQ